MMNDILINVSDERGAAIGEAFLSGYRYIKRIFRGTSSSGSGKVKVFMIMGINPEKCKWRLIEKYLFDVHHTQCGKECYVGASLKETEDSPKYQYCQFCGKEIEEI